MLLALSIPLGVFAVMFLLWITRGRDPRRRPIVPRYEPPDGLTPVELGTLADNSPDMRDISATLVDLAVRGYIFLEEKEEAKLLGLYSTKEYVFHLRKSGIRHGLVLAEFWWFRVRRRRGRRLLITPRRTA
jgi:hypothetical protein